MNPYNYPTPCIVPFHGDWAIVGTDYGYLHTTSGDVRTWKTRSGARKALKRYLNR